MTSEAIVIVLIALATHRLTRLVTKDAITEGARLKLQMHFEQRWESRTGKTSQDIWGSKLAYVLGCSWCSSMYIAAAVTAVTAQATSVPLPILTALAASSVTGILDSE